MEKKIDLDELVRRRGTTEEGTSQLEMTSDKPQKPENREQRPRRTTQESIQGLRDNHKICNVCVYQREKKEKKERYETIVTENSPKFTSDTHPWIQGVEEHQAGEMGNKTKQNYTQPPKHNDLKWIKIGKYWFSVI